jgi:hypothetical protein
MSEQPDDLEAVRTLVTTLEKFKNDEQERIIRWAMEKLGLEKHPVFPIIPPPQAPEYPARHNQSTNDGTPKDLKSFVIDKNPASDMQFATVVAYYYKFEAHSTTRKDSINAEILQDATRLSGRTRLTKPVQTLVNASFNGLLDKADEKGAYKINTVGENLVAMTLPQSTNSKSSKPKPRSRKSQTTKIKKPQRKIKS